MARLKGFEPLTYRFVACCSIQLSYSRTLRGRLLPAYPTEVKQIFTLFLAHPVPLPRLLADLQKIFISPLVIQTPTVRASSCAPTQTCQKPRPALHSQSGYPRPHPSRAHPLRAGKAHTAAGHVAAAAYTAPRTSHGSGRMRAKGPAGESRVARGQVHGPVCGGTRRTAYPSAAG